MCQPPPRRLEEGRYLIRHKAGEPFVTIFKAGPSEKVTRGTYDLQQVHGALPRPSTTPAPWLPVDPSVVMPFHRSHWRVPCTFPPREVPTVTTHPGTWPLLLSWLKDFVVRGKRVVKNDATVTTKYISILNYSQSSNTLALSHTRSFSHSLFLTLALPHTRSPSHSLSLTLALPQHSLSLTLALTHSLSPHAIIFIYQALLTMHTNIIL